MTATFEDCKRDAVMPAVAKLRAAGIPPGHPQYLSRYPYAIDEEARKIAAQRGVAVPPPPPLKTEGDFAREAARRTSAVGVRQNTPQWTPAYLRNLEAVQNEATAANARARTIAAPVRIEAKPAQTRSATRSAAAPSTVVKFPGRGARIAVTPQADSPERRELIAALQTLRDFNLRATKPERYQAAYVSFTTSTVTLPRSINYALTGAIADASRGRGSAAHVRAAADAAISCVVAQTEGPEAA